MKVNKLMTSAIAACDNGDSLADAVKLMWEKDCGMVPVIENEVLVGVITDRDVAVAVSSSGRRADEILVSELTGKSLVTCREKDDVRRALKLMAKNKLRRLLVVDKKRRLKGIFSIADVVTASEKRKNCESLC